jgi:hypothetical protein
LFLICEQFDESSKPIILVSFSPKIINWCV